MVEFALSYCTVIFWILRDIQSDDSHPPFLSTENQTTTLPEKKSVGLIESN